MSSRQNDLRARATSRRTGKKDLVTTRSNLPFFITFVRIITNDLSEWNDK
jgi:hypothetical protein